MQSTERALRLRFYFAKALEYSLRSNLVSKIHLGCSLTPLCRNYKLDKCRRKTALHKMVKLQMQANNAHKDSFTKGTEWSLSPTPKEFSCSVMPTMPRRLWPRWGGGGRKSLGPMNSSDTCFAKTQNSAKTQTIDRNVHKSDRSPCDLQASGCSWFAIYLLKPMHSIHLADIVVEGDNGILRKTSARHGDSWDFNYSNHSRTYSSINENQEPKNIIQVASSNSKKLRTHRDTIRVVWCRSSSSAKRRHFVFDGPIALSEVLITWS